ncbi:MAG: alpha/beta hydrolase [Bacteroidetes bacterium]|nr:alpha/beta hydrolase [Bacteroidota bacterium]
MKLFLSTTLIFIISFSFGQVSNKISIGTVDSVYSQILKENREIWVYVPESAKNNPKQKYPVIYLLDGDNYFHSFTGEVSHLSEVNGNAIIPDMIVIGIVNTNRGRDLTTSYDSLSNYKPNGGAELFTSFIEKELIPYVESHYSTAPYRMLVGHSLGGLFVTNTLLKHTSLFNSYLALDPSFDWDKKKLLLESKSIMANDKFENKSFFLGGSSLCTESNNEFETVLKSNAPPSLNWTSKYYNEDSHGSVPLIGSYDGLRFIFKFYKRPSFVKMTDSSANILSTHYENLSKKMGFTIYPPEDLILGLAWRCRALDKKYDMAYSFLKLAEKYYPESADVYSALGDLFSDKGEAEKSKKYFEKAQQLTTTEEKAK